jgi:hypothetical protein
MTLDEFITWLRGHMMQANYADNFNWEILNRLIQIQPEQPKSTQLEIPFPDNTDKGTSKTIWVSDSTSGKHTYTTFNYKEDDGTIY